MALYVTRPRRDEERIGRGLPNAEFRERQEVQFVYTLWWKKVWKCENSDVIDKKAK